MKKVTLEEFKTMKNGTLKNHKWGQPKCYHIPKVTICKECRTRKVAVEIGDQIKVMCFCDVFPQHGDTVDFTKYREEKTT